jgi:hypothetical protein
MREGRPGFSLREGIEVRGTAVLGVLFSMGAINASQAVPTCWNRLRIVLRGPFDVAHGADAGKAVIAHDVTAWEIIYAVLRVRFFWPLYGLLYLCVGMNLKTRLVEYRTRTGFTDAPGPPEVVPQTCHPALPGPLPGEDHAEIGVARSA